MPVITVGRQFGAGGETVGRMLAERLGADLVDSKIIDEVARRLEVPEGEVRERDEDPASLVERLVAALGSVSIDLSAPPEMPTWTPPYADPVFDLRKAVLRLTQEVIKEAARSGNAVIVGRGGAFILRDQPDATHVFLLASKESRMEVVMQMLGVDREEALRRIRQHDTNRAAYVRQVYGHEWLDPRHYDVVLDSGRLGYEACTEAVLAAIARRS